ncbi:response regulator [Aquimarina spongiae]|uniref:DNA-binding response regulator, NarL/FixJ family, contains REC and HTH domains n=1 Tax=Aquimarina spongiae TaxID=570521 RepID=A0A1M6I7I1_9FLAO|nr:response regulator [Aquimarina spongiae]SHJ30431.1 DNA-binding response regulator, NarL/FixJ family, contains REC and HTH domains [Aquimarina spongiae]
MFKKVLVNEDLGSINHGVANILHERTRIKEIQQAQYCDDAYLKFRRALKDQTPFDLLVTDLSFKESHRERKLVSGVELIEAVRLIQPNIKVIVYSMEDRPAKVRSLFDEHNINGYVCKGRYGLNELVQSVYEVYNENRFISQRLSNMMSKHNVFELKDYDLLLLKHLSDGLTQEQIGEYFKKNHISPNSISSIEKRLNKLKFNFKARNAIHLVAMTKDLGLL